MTEAVSKIRVSSQKYEGTQKKTVTEAKLWNIKGERGNVEETEEKVVFESLND